MKFSILAVVQIAGLAAVSSFVVQPSSSIVKPILPKKNVLALKMSSVAADQAPPPSPLTSWGQQFEDIVQTQKASKAQSLPEFSIEISGADIQDETEYFRSNRETILQMMQDHGAVIFRNFDLMKTQEGFQEFYQLLGMKSCLDPLHSVSARPTVNGDKNSPIYEAVNKESRKNFFIGMHNEFVGTRAPRAAAFCCFKAAETGGEFIVADGRRIFQDLPESILKDLYGRQIRYSVMELPFFNWINSLPEFAQSPMEGLVQGLASMAINAKVDFNVDLQWGVSDYDGAKMLQARAPPQPPIVAHPVTSEPTWFCNVHSHSSLLRQQREQVYGAERFEDGASRINKSDMFFGSGEPLTREQLEVLDQITTRHMKYVKMTEGDVVLLDNYKTMHGRNVFDGTRKHGVCWFGGWEGEEKLRKQTSTANPAVANA